MLSLPAKIREITGRKTNNLRKEGLLPAVLYGPKTETINLEIEYKEFERVLKQAGESSLVTLEIEEKKEKPLVLIHEIQKDPLTDKYIHVDFYQAPLTEEIEVHVPLIFEGESLAVKESGGTLIKNISEIEVKALPKNLPHEIKVNIERLKTFENEILVKDLKMPENVKVLREPDEIVAHVAELTKVDEELAKEIEEKVEEVDKVEKVEKVEKEEKVIEKTVSVNATAGKGENAGEKES